IMFRNYIVLILGVLLSQKRSVESQSPGSRRSAATSQSPQLGAFAYLAEPRSFRNLIRSEMPMPLLSLCPWLSPLPLPLPCGYIADRTLPQSPTGDAAAPPVSAPPLQPLAFSRASRHFPSSPIPMPAGRCPAPPSAACSAPPALTDSAAV